MMPGCSLDEVNPGGFTLENLSTSAEGYETLLNQCYFGLERHFYGSSGTGDAVLGYMSLVEPDTDLWTYQGNQDSGYDYLFKFYGGASPNTTYTNNIWNAAYDGIGGCNLAIASIDNASFSDQATRNAKLAEARFLRAVYYYNLVEMFGGVVMLTEPSTTIDYAPQRTEPLTIYREVIIPDLQYAAENLTVGDNTTTTTPTRKSALGFLAKACLQTYQYDTTEFLQTGMNAARALIDDCEGGGSQYNTYMYATPGEVFAQENNAANREALWKTSLVATSTGHGSSNGNYRLNRNHEYFLCRLERFGARVDNYDARLEWGEGWSGTYMPTQYLLSLYVQDDGTLDPRFHQWFRTEWDANQEYTWTEGDVNTYDKAANMVGQTIAVGDKAVKFVMPQDDDYAEEIANKANSNYLLIDYNDVYDDATRSIIMRRGSGENLYRYFYPSLNKHFSNNFYRAHATNQNRLGNLNATFIMRMSEVYLIAAELDIYLNGGANAMNYINVVRQRAGANPLTGAASVRTVLDERARELCGEYCRFFDLKRTGMFDDNAYLQETHPDLAQYFRPEYALRPISTTYTATITNGAEFQNPGY